MVAIGERELGSGLPSCERLERVPDGVRTAARVVASCDSSDADTTESRRAVEGLPGSSR